MERPRVVSKNMTLGVAPRGDTGAEDRRSAVDGLLTGTG